MSGRGVFKEISREEFTGADDYSKKRQESKAMLKCPVWWEAKSYAEGAPDLNDRMDDKMNFRQVKSEVMARH